MCGITGYFTTTDDHLRNSDIVTRMSSALIHRGPDDFGVWIDQKTGVALGHRRLSIIDLSDAGHQPMTSYCGRYVCVYNGEIYNFLELKAELEQESPPPWKGHCDTEVMLAGFSMWGIEKTLQKMNGMFACAVFDRESAALTLFRDRMGKKPLYYGFQGNTFMFASELKSLRRHPDFEGAINRNALALFLRHNYVPQPYSIYENIYKLPQASLITITREGMRTHFLPQPVTYWDMETSALPESRDPSLTGTMALEQLDNLLADAVKRRMISDVPLGVFLSGGIDSSLVTALMQRASSRPVQTFTIGFHDEAFNEAEAAREVARHLGTDHTELYCTPEEALAVIPRLPSMFDEPFADSSQIPTLLVAQLAKSRVTVALSGDGGDELFGGYGRYITSQLLYNKLKRIPRSFRRAAAGILYAVARPFAISSTRADRLLKLCEITGFQDRVAFYRDTFLSHWKKPDDIVIDAREPDSFSSGTRDFSRQLPFIETMMYLDAGHYLPDDILVKVDRTSMAVSLETRSPLLDYRVFEFAWRLPLSQKIRNGQGKYILRELLARHVPRHLFERPKKGFSVPIASWLRGPLKDWAENLLDGRRLTREGFFKAQAIRDKFHDHLKRGRNFSYYLWDILMFQAWLEENRGD